MTDTAGVTGGCNALCGCPVPCPGGNSCGCRGADHNKCSCGEHCGCNPCSCQKESGGGVMMRVGKAHCKCGSGCTCTACAA
ncbi:Metallothionein-like protein 4B [Linum perenne]